MLAFLKISGRRGAVPYGIAPRLPNGEYNCRRRYNLSIDKYHSAKQNITSVLYVTTNLSRLLLALLVKSTLPTERAPFVALRHFPRFIGEIYPKGESKKC